MRPNFIFLSDNLNFPSDNYLSNSFLCPLVRGKPTQHTFHRAKLPDVRGSTPPQAENPGLWRLKLPNLIFPRTTCLIIIFMPTCPRKIRPAELLLEPYCPMCGGAPPPPEELRTFTPDGAPAHFFPAQSHFSSDKNPPISFFLGPHAKLSFLCLLVQGRSFRS